MDQNIVEIKRRKTVNNNKLCDWLFHRNIESGNRESIASTSHNTPKMEFYHKGQKELCEEIVKLIAKGEFD